MTADTLRRRIHEELGFTVNIGISENKLLAKMASDFQKPNRTHTLFPEEIPRKMWPLPVTDLFFVGRASFSRLRRLGISTIGELAHTDRELLRTHFKSYGEVIWNYANGRDCAQVESVVPPNKGYGNSTTIAFDICDTVSAGLVLLSLAETIGMRLRRDQVKIQVIAVSIKYADFSSCSHQKTLPAPTNNPGTAARQSGIWESIRTMYGTTWITGSCIYWIWNCPPSTGTTFPAVKSWSRRMPWPTGFGAVTVSILSKGPFS